MRPISVVVADRSSDGDAVRTATRALLQELDPDGDEVVWVGGAGPPPEPVLPSVTRVPAAADAGRGQLNALGLACTRHAIVAFTDSETVLLRGWRAAAASAFPPGDDHAQVVGGPVLPSVPRSMRSWAGFFVEYGPHAVAPFTSAGGDPAGNNVVYARRLLLGSGEGALWKTAVHARLRASGVQPRVVPGMRAMSTRSYSWGDLGGGRVARGRLYGAQRAASWSVGRRLAAALGCLSLPLLAAFRLATRLSSEPRLRRQFLLSSPLVLVALVAWSVGEAAGYVFRSADERGLW